MKIRENVDLNILKGLGYKELGDTFDLDNEYVLPDGEGDYTCCISIDKKSREVEWTITDCYNFYTLSKVVHNLDLLQEYCEKESN